MRIPGFSQGIPAPKHLKRRTYGGDDTIHQTGTIDIQVDEQTGEVQAVWFRCRTLPFRVSKIPHEQNSCPVNPKIVIEAVTYVDGESTL